MIFYALCSTLLHLTPPDFAVSEDAGIEPRNVATLALTVRRSNQGLHPQTRLDLHVIHLG